MAKRIYGEIRSPLRYPGGKSKFLNQILPNIPTNYNEFREPFVGGGSVFLAAMQTKNKRAIYKINDLNYDLYCFWKELKENGERLVKDIYSVRRQSLEGKELFSSLTGNNKDYTTFERAVRFFILNRITFSGTADSGGFSIQAFQRRFTDSSIERLEPVHKLLKDVIITHSDYERLVLDPGQDIFIFLDPPYLTATKSNLYGKNGDLHRIFDHEHFARVMEKCPHQWLITYDDCKEIRDLYNFGSVYFYAWTAQYGMTNVAKNSADKGKELLIANYPLLRKQNALKQSLL